jgi:phosphoglycerate dehydrogenase-like enzyme
MPSICFGVRLHPATWKPSRANVVVAAAPSMPMTEYVVLQVLMIHGQQRRYDAQQRQRVWYELPQPAAHEVSVGVMGLGVVRSASTMRTSGTAGSVTSPVSVDLVSGH